MMIVKIDDREVNRFLKGLPQKIKKEIGEKIQSWGIDTQEQMRLASMYGKGGKKPHFWSGEVYQSIKWRKKQIGGTLEISKEGLYLDDMTPHWVALKRGRKITHWAIDKGIATTAGRGARPVATIYATEDIYLRSIFVRPHPFIDKCVNKQIPKLDKYLQKAVDKIK